MVEDQKLYALYLKSWSWVMAGKEPPILPVSNDYDAQWHAAVALGVMDAKAAGYRSPRTQKEVLVDLKKLLEADRLHDTT